MAFSDYLPIWDKLTRQQQEQISGVVEFRSVKKGTHIHDSSAECLGLVLVKSGQLRAYILSEDGRKLLQLFNGYQNELRTQADILFEKYFKGVF